MPIPLRSALLPAAAAALLCAGCAQPPQRTGDTAGETVARTLPAAECLDPDRARAWSLIDSNELVVDAGRRHYLIRLSFACPSLGTTPAIVFRTGSGIGRVCGNVGDAIVPQAASHVGPACDIAAVVPITAEQYQRLAGGGERVEGRMRIDGGE